MYQSRFMFLFAVLLLSNSSTYAWRETDDQNMSGPVVRVIKKYPGKWKGWSDGCINCNKPMSIDIRKKDTSTKSKRKVVGKNNQTNKMTASTKLPKSMRRGYCECNCNMAGKLSTPFMHTTQKVFGVKNTPGTDETTMEVREANNNKNTEVPGKHHSDKVKSKEEDTPEAQKGVKGQEENDINNESGESNVPKDLDKDKTRIIERNY